MSGRFAASNKVAIVGYAHSQVVRHADRPLGGWLSKQPAPQSPTRAVSTASTPSGRSAWPPGCVVADDGNLVAAPPRICRSPHELESGNGNARREILERDGNVITDLKVGLDAVEQPADEPEIVLLDEFDIYEPMAIVVEARAKPGQVHNRTVPNRSPSVNSNAGALD